ncbi:trehalose-6-phosphate synthase [Campylobacter sp. MIT 12-5580]|uniref:trehalose-6-phosphate synthase n=1 Tax=Campylobacter sp. MIT 12-5580 TaxID=2040651 RepID=UPI0010F7FAF0|nr:trehalose-6-phosphate synthase [Campylobacter sp. MIT 12-5580]TKX29629.1 trehalose-6-phosphate synthase [Campylobacter sp. MIT 12-5580]
MFYTLVKIIHLLCACVVIGYLIYDVFIFSHFKKNRSEVEFIKLKRELLKPSALILGLAFLLLLCSGAYLASFYLGGELGWLESSFQQILVLKISVVGLLFVFTPISFFYILVLKKSDPMRKFYHHLALLICLIALIFAKLMFLF